MSDVLQLISVYGFPIVMCILIWWQNKELHEELTELVKSNTAAMTELRNAIEEGSRHE